MQHILEVDSVIKSYNTKLVLSDVYIKCCSGDVIGLFGRNGTGKSSLLKIIFGTLPAENKFIRIDQQVVDKPYLKRDCINYLPQDGFIPTNITVRQAIDLYCNGESDSFTDDPILNKVMDTQTSNLSGGEGRYLEVKILLFSKAKFVLLDEPFNGVSPILKDSIKDLIKQQSKNKGIILTDHDYQNVLTVANRFYLMFDGGMKAVTDKNDLIDWGYVPESKRKIAK